LDYWSLGSGNHGRGFYNGRPLKSTVVAPMVKPAETQRYKTIYRYRAENIVKTTPTPDVGAKILFIAILCWAGYRHQYYYKGIDPFEFVEPLFKNYDSVIANLETTVTDKGVAAPGKALYFSDTARGDNYLQIAGIKTVSLANNHTKDYGNDGLLDTIDRLTTGGIRIFRGRKKYQRGVCWENHYR